MKKTLTLLVMFFGFVAAFAQTAPTFPYQAVVRNSQNQLMRDTTITIDVTVKQAGVVKYHEICPDVPTNHNGMLSFIIGAPADPTYAEHSLSDVTDWSKVSFTFVYHLSDGDVTVTDSIRPVPYALQSADSPSLTNLENRVNTFNTHVCDSVAACLDGANNALSQQIVRIVGDTLANGNSALNHIVDTIATNNVRTYVDTSSHFVEAINKIIDTSSAVSASVIQTVSDTLANANSALNHIVDTIVSKAVSDSTITVQLNGTTVGSFSLNQNSKDTVNIVIRETVDYITLASDQTADTQDFTLSQTPKANFAVKMYVNGVFVGDNARADALNAITVSGTDATYNSANNSGYKLKTTDRIQIVYFY